MDPATVDRRLQAELTRSVLRLCAPEEVAGFDRTPVEDLSWTSDSPGRLTPHVWAIAGAALPAVGAALRRPGVPPSARLTAAETEDLRQVVLEVCWERALPADTAALLVDSVLGCVHGG